MLEEVAKRWVPGEGPVEIEPLTSGLVNRSYRVLRDARIYSLRIAAADSRSPGVDRRWECRIRATAQAAGLAPAVRRCDPIAGILVADWASGRCWTPDEVNVPSNIDAMAALLRRVHALQWPEPLRLMNPAAWIACYATDVEPAATDGLGGDEQLRQEAASRLAALGPAPRRAVCHSDVHRLNVLIGEAPLLLDWEYAHVSEPLWDVAGWISNNDWPAVTAARFLASYLDGRVLPEDARRLEHLLWLYDYVCVLWSARFAQARPGEASEAIRSRAAGLTQRLLAAASGSRAGEVPANYPP